MSRRSASEEDRYLEFQLDGKQVVIVMVGILLLCSISFYFGRRVGRAEAAGKPAPLLSSMSEAVPGTLQEEDAGDDLTFFDTVGSRPQQGTPPPVASGPESGSAPRSEPPREERPATPAPGTTTAGQEPAKTPTPAAAPSTSGSGIQVQVGSFSERTQADSLASGLRAKGYRPTVSTTSSNGKTVYRVRVGGYATRDAAEQAARRLEREEQLKTWIPPAE